MYAAVVFSLGEGVTSATLQIPMQQIKLTLHIAAACPLQLIFFCLDNHFFLSFLLFSLLIPL